MLLQKISVISNFTCFSNLLQFQMIDLLLLEDAVQIQMLPMLVNGDLMAQVKLLRRIRASNAAFGYIQILFFTLQIQLQKYPFQLKLI